MRSALQLESERRQDVRGALRVSKYADHLPLYRQCKIYERHDIELERSTLAD